MGSLFALLTVYYGCDAAAGQMQLSVQEAVACTATYEAVKIAFLPENMALPADHAHRAEALRAGYIAFKAWEAANPATVTTLRSGV